MKQKDLSETIGSLERQLSLPPGFLLDLRKEDDWSFIIKAHAFLEAVLSHVLAEASGKRELEGVLSRLEMSDTAKGKLAFAQALGVLEEDERRFIKRLSELRNMLVHNISNVGFNMSKYVNQLDSNQRTSFVEAFKYALDPEDKGFQRLIGTDVRGRVLKDPQGAIFMGVVLITLALCDKKEVAQREEKRIAKMKTLVERLRGMYAKRQTEHSKEAAPQS